MSAYLIGCMLCIVCQFGLFNVPLKYKIHHLSLGDKLQLFNMLNRG